MENMFSASWVRGRPAYWILGARVARDIGYQHAKDNKLPLPREFYDWHKANDRPGSR